MQYIGAPAISSYYNAFTVYDYISYLYAHNTSTYDAFTSPVPGWREEGSPYSDLDRLRWFADKQMTSFLGNVSAENPYDRSLSAATKGSISTIAGATLAAKVLSQMSTNIRYAGEASKLNILVGDFDAFISFFALAGLTNHDSNFLGLPAYGSAMVFELYSYTDSTSSNSSSTTSTFPDENDLWVRFLFRNGTDNSTWTSSQDSVLAGLQAYPLFGRGPSTSDMLWTDFVPLMQDIAINGPGDWCQMCVSAAFWCAAWNATNAVDSGNTGSAVNGRQAGVMSPMVAGFVGAVVAFIVAGLAVAAFALAGLRVHRVAAKRTSGVPSFVIGGGGSGSSGGGVGGGKAELGGFKGSRKLGSDVDLVLPKSGFNGAHVERVHPDLRDDDAAGAKERVGSWELKDSGARFGASVESLDVGGLPVRPNERV